MRASLATAGAATLLMRVLAMLESERLIEIRKLL